MEGKALSWDWDHVAFLSLGRGGDFTIRKELGAIDLPSGERLKALAVFSPVDKMGAGPFGPGWRLPLLDSCVVPVDKDTFKVLGLDGWWSEFKVVKNTPGKYSGGGFQYRAAAEKRGDAIQITARDGSRLVYLSGKLSRITLPSGTSLGVKRVADGSAALLNGAAVLMELGVDPLKPKPGEWQVKVGGKNLLALVGERPLTAMVEGKLKAFPAVPALVSVSDLKDGTKLLDFTYDQPEEGVLRVANRTDLAQAREFKELEWFPGKVRTVLDGVSETHEVLSNGRTRTVKEIPGVGKIVVESDRERGYEKRVFADGGSEEAWRFGNDVKTHSKLKDSLRRKLTTYPDGSVKELRRKVDELGRVTQETITWKEHKTVRIWHFYGDSEQLRQTVLEVDSEIIESCVYDERGRVRSLKNHNFEIVTGSDGEVVIRHYQARPLSALGRALNP